MVIVGCALFADWLPFIKDPNYLYGYWGDAPRSGNPSADYWLGTDIARRDVLARLVFGARLAVFVAAVTVTVGGVVGGVLGSWAGFAGGRIDTVIVGALDAVLAFPVMVLVIVLVAITEQRNLVLVSLLIGVAFVPMFARVARATAMSVSRREFVTAARAIGTTRTRILFREVVPNVVPTLGAYAVAAAAIAIVIEASLAFIGFGAASRLPSWGRMILEARVDVRVTVYPMIYPSVVITLTVLSLNVVADWCRSLTATRASALA